MIDIQNSKELKIKRANTDWWINEKSAVGANGMTYIAYVNDTGEIHIREICAFDRNVPMRDVCLCRLNCNYADEHNAPAICITGNGKIIVSYTGHGENGYMKYRVTDKAYDIYSFGEEKTLNYDGSVTYAQISENTERKELWLFCRVNGVTWEFRYSRDYGESWSVPRKFLASDAGGLFYLNIRKQLVSTSKGTSEQWFFAFYGHPRISKDHTVRSGIFTSDGRLVLACGSETDVNLFDNEKLIDIESMPVVYESPDGTTCRLLEVSPTMPLRVAICTFELDKPETAVYYCSSFFGGKWRLSKPVAKAGEFLAPQCTDGSQTYVPGMAFYYGVGGAGFHECHPAYIDTDRIFLARCDNENRYVESYVSHDNGESYVLEQEIKRIPKSEGKKIWRPTAPVYAQDNLQLYWHEGIYSAHTGGWHCDAVMLCDFDNC